jgi:hypothetical protein
MTQCRIHRKNEWNLPEFRVTWPRGSGCRIPRGFGVTCRGWLKRLGMLVRISEVAAVLALVLALLMAKHVPALALLPLSNMAGIVCFSFAIYLCLKLFEDEVARLRAED